MAPDSSAPPPWGVASWADAEEWHRRLNGYAVAEAPGLVVAGHLQGLYPGPAKLYALVRGRRGVFVGLVCAFADSGSVGTEADLFARQRLLERFDLAAFAGALAAHLPELSAGRKEPLRAALRAHRRETLAFDLPGLGRVVPYPLRFPTLVRDLGLDPSHPMLGVRRDWMTVVDLGRRARLMPTPEVFARFLAREEAIARRALAPLAAGLVDRAALEVLGLATQYRFASYAFYRGAGERAEVRRQAARSFPVFARALSEVPALRRAVDMRAPLVPALAGVLQVSEAVLRRFHGFGLRVVPDHAEYLLMFLDDIDGSLCPGRRPVPSAEPEDDPWACFASLAQEINSLAAFIGGRDGGRRQALRGLLKGFDGDWCALFRAVGGERVRPAVPITRVPEIAGSTADVLHPRRRAQEEDRIAAAIAWDNFRHLLRLPWGGENIRDGARAFAYSVCLPLAAHDSGLPVVAVDTAALRRAEAAATAFLLASRTLPQIVRFSDRFHRSIGILFPQVSLKNVQGASLAWSRPSPPLTAPGGLGIVPLGSVQDLVEEGEALGNCLPLYAVPCAIEGHRVLSVRRAGQRIAAFEIARATGRAPWRLRQVEGPRNRPAPEEVIAAAGWYLDWLAARGDGAAVPADTARGDTDVLRALCGYDWRDAAAVETMWALWARSGPAVDGGERPPPVLPRAAVRRGLEGLRALPAFTALRDALAPPAG
ncbi:hypothetical protein ACM64Y_02860 [Novispirillum sp. DQ9]|uniref:hypothetical protein n=1 Tax=Novispirillum sp. DQ9 TaxID=3398612 RepID=UPI003C79D672